MSGDLRANGYPIDSVRGEPVEPHATSTCSEVPQRFFGNSENAVKTQIWCAIATYVLIAIVKKQLQLDASLYTVLQILSVSLFEKNELSCALQPDAAVENLRGNANQLILFES